VVTVIQDQPEQAAPLCAEAEASGVRTRRIEAFGRVNWKAVTGLRAVLRAENVRILHTHGYKTDLIGLLATRGTGCRIVSTPHGWSVRAGLKLQAYEALDRAAFPLFDAVVPLSDALYGELASIPGLRRRLHLIRNGVDIAEIDAVTAVAPEALAWGREDEFVVGYIGQLIARKGLDVLLQAFARARLGRKRLVLLGEGPQRGELEQLAQRLAIREQVEVLGFRDDRLAFLKGFDVFVLPSRLEGIPRCLMEAMAARVPIIATDIPGCADLVTHAETGLLFAVDDVHTLSATLERVRDRSLRRDLASRARERVVKTYSAEAMAREYQALFSSLLGVRT
jgi:glycosyltransferase involved in cell wall biosynthesis